jgi:hypothetical protein
MLKAHIAANQWMLLPTPFEHHPLHVDQISKHQSHSQQQQSVSKPYSQAVSAKQLICLQQAPAESHYAATYIKALDEHVPQFPQVSILDLAQTCVFASTSLTQSHQMRQAFEQLATLAPAI